MKIINFYAWISVTNVLLVNRVQILAEHIWCQVELGRDGSDLWLKHIQYPLLGR